MYIRYIKTVWTSVQTHVWSQWDENIKVGKTKIDGIRSQQIRESCSIQPINEWVERRRERDEHVTRKDAERLAKFQGTIYQPYEDL